LFASILQMTKQKPIKKVFFDLNHPADFHFFKHLITWMHSKGYVIKIVARDKECLHMLLDDAGISYTSRGSGKHTLAGKYVYAIWILFLLLVELIRFRPSIAMSLSSPYLAVLTRLLGIICITYDDTDDNPRLLPLIRKTRYLLSPSTYPHKFHKGHFHLPTLKELAYLHPEQFKLDTNQAGVFFRITRTDSIHHSSASVLNEETVLKKMHQLSQKYPIVLSSEKDLDFGDDKSIHLADPLLIHRDLANCKLFWGNSATMAAEAVVLGIPAIYVSAEKFAYIHELEDYGLLFHYHPDDLHGSLEKLDSILAGNPPISQFKKAHALLLRDKIDMTTFMIWFIETLPESASILEKDEAYARKFIT
jgi:predicted glycosyltransferase